MLFSVYLCGVVSFSFNNIWQRFSRMPMAGLVLALIAGIVLASYYSVSLWIWAAIAIAGAALSAVWGYAVLAMVVGLGGIVYSINSYQMLPCREPLQMVVKVTDDGVDYGRYSTFTADVLQCNSQSTRARVRLTVDSLFTPQAGDIMDVYGTVRPFTPEQSSYAEAMHRQGFSGRVTVNSYNVSNYCAAERQSLHSRAMARLRSLLPRSEGSDVAIAVSLGAKSITEPELKRSYSYSGLSHLLAVSGLHVGMVAMLLNLLLLPLALLWRGNMVRSVVAMAMIWLYIAMCGYPTSAIRAAVMFSVLQLSFMLKNRYAVENSLCTAAFAMLAIEPTMLFEPSFELSFIAVMAIVFVASPVEQLLHIENRFVREFVGGIVISIACVTATAPLISHSFGVVSLLSVVLTPIALVAAEIIIVSIFVALVAPLPLAHIAAKAAELCGSLQNSLVMWSVESGIGFAELRIDYDTMMIIYAIFALMVFLSFGFKIEQRGQ